MNVLTGKEGINRPKKDDIDVGGLSLRIGLESLFDDTMFRDIHSGCEFAPGDNLTVTASAASDLSTVW